MAVFHDQVFRPVAQGQRNIALGDKTQQIVHQILPPTGARSVEAFDGMTDMTIGSDEFHPRAQFLNQPFA